VQSVGEPIMTPHNVEWGEIGAFGVVIQTI